MFRAKKADHIGVLFTAKKPDGRWRRGAELGVFDLLFDQGAHAEPRLDLDDIPVEVGQDEAVGKERAELACF